MPFPTSNISATSIRQELASNNTGGVQTPVTLNDVAVRAAASRPSGAVSYGDLSGVNVLFSGLVTLQRRVLAPFPGTVIRLWGYVPNFVPQFGGPIGSLNTASYYRIAPIGSVNSAPLSVLVYDDSNTSGGTANKTEIGFGNGFVSFPVNTMSINFGGTRITAVPTFVDPPSGAWGFTGDPFGFTAKGDAGLTSQVVITYT